MLGGKTCRDVRSTLSQRLTVAALLSRARNPGEWFALFMVDPDANPSQPDGYLTEERKAADPDQGFSTFFSETGMN